MYIHTEEIHNYCAAEQILPLVYNIYKPSSILDIGCGLGTWLKVAKDLGTQEILGIDGSYVNRDLLKLNNSEFLEHDLRTKLNLKKKFDLVISLEVAEHIPEECTNIYIQSLCSHSDVILFSAAIPGQGGQNHVNEQWPEYWQKKFRSEGFDLYDCFRNEIWLNEKIDWWYRQNIVLSIKETHPLVSICKKGVLPLVHPELLVRKTLQLETENKNIQDELLKLRSRTLTDKLLDRLNLHKKH